MERRSRFCVHFTVNNQEIYNRLVILAEPGYRDFSSALIPGAQMLGVRLPALRKLAREIAKEDALSYLNLSPGSCFEETMLYGMVIGYARMGVEERLAYISGFIPLIDNWSVCDSFCTTLKFAREARERVWSFLRPYMEGGREFETRFAIVMAINHFVTEDYAPRFFEALDKIPLNGYYARMAAAWALSAHHVKLPELTEEYLRQCRVDAEVWRLTLKKLRESRCISKDKAAFISNFRAAD